MQYDVTTPAEYLKILDQDWRLETLTSLRKMIKSKGPDLAEGINYKMLSYSDGKGVIFHLNVQKNYVGLYVGNVKKIDPDGSLLKGLDTGKGCIRFKKTVNLADTKVDEFVERAIQLWQRGVDIDC